MLKSTVIAPVNSLVFIHGLHGWVSPLPVDGKLIWATPSCIATACYPETDGPTKIIMGSITDIDLPSEPVFDGLLEVAGGIVAITTVDDDRPAVALEVSQIRIRVKIWHSHPLWPQTVTIGLSDLPPKAFPVPEPPNGHRTF